MQLATYLRKRQMTQTAFAMLTGIGNPMVNHLVSGKRKPSLKLALEIEKKTRGAIPVSTWK